MALPDTYCIGGLGLRLAGADLARRAARLEGLAAFAAGTGDSSLRICAAEEGPMPEFGALSGFEMGDGAQCRFGRTGEGELCYAFGDDGWLRTDGSDLATVHLHPPASNTRLRFMLWVAYYVLGLGHGAVPLHASAVVHQGRAVLCLGESGTGKSTHTRLWMDHVEGCHLLNDDSPILRLRDGEAWAYGSPWSGKTPCYRAEAYPVAGLVRIEQRPTNRIERLGVAGAYAALLPSCPPALPYDERCLDRVTDLLSAVIGRVPVYHLGCRPDAEAARLCHQTLFPTTP